MVMVMHAREGAPGGTNAAARIAALAGGAPERTLAANVVLALPGGAGGMRTSQRQETIAVVLAGMMTLTLDDTAMTLGVGDATTTLGVGDATTTLGVGDTVYLAAGTAFTWRNGGDTPAALLLVTGESYVDAAPRSGVLAEAARNVDGPPQVWPDEGW